MVAVKILQPPASVVFGRNWQKSKLDRNGRKKIQTEVNLNKEGGFENLKKYILIFKSPILFKFHPLSVFPHETSFRS